MTHAFVVESRMVWNGPAPRLSPLQRLVTWFNVRFRGALPGHGLVAQVWCPTVERARLHLASKPGARVRKVPIEHVPMKARAAFAAAQAG